MWKFLMLMALVMSFGALRVKDVGRSAEKWSRNASAAGADYASGAAAAGPQWAANTVAAAQTFGQAVAAAGIVERFRRGVQRAGAEKYARKIVDVGASRYGSGVQAAQGDWQAGFEPYAATLASLTLPQRRPRGDPGNLARVQAVMSALNTKRLALLGGGS
jgi:hypothetical protein